MWDTKLNFCAHIKYLKSKCTKALNLLKSLAHTDWGGDLPTLLKLYRSLIRSKLDYGSIVYGSTRNSYISALDPIHNQGLRLCLGAFRSTPMESLYVLAHEPSLYDRRKKLALQYYTKLKANPDNPAYKLVFHPNYVNKFRDRPRAIAPFGVRMRPLVQEVGLNVNNIATNTVPDTPIWDAPEIKVCLDLTAYNKSTTLPEVFKAKFLELRERFPRHYAIYTDGSKQDERVASAMFSKYGTRSARLPNGASIFSAEVQAISRALNYVRCSHLREFIIYSDSLSVLQSIESQE